jgi:lipoprotein-anchoring transpeptidase ErfK/SrfK
MTFQFPRIASSHLLAAAAAVLWIGTAVAAPLPASYAIAREPMDTQVERSIEQLNMLAPNLRRQVVDFATPAAPGTVVIDTSQTYLYFVLNHGKAIRYGIGVGRDGFTWSGAHAVTRKAEWPDWTPPQEMIARQPYLPRFMAGGEGNPLGARAIYLGATVYRIHGTNMPSTIGHKVSSGCIRMVNEDVIDLYSRIDIGTKVVVLPNRANVAIIRPASGQAVPR